MSGSGRTGKESTISPEQAEIVAKLTEIEAQAKLLLEELAVVPSLQRTRINHIVGLSAYLRTQIEVQLTLVRKDHTAQGR